MTTTLQGIGLSITATTISAATCGVCNNLMRVSITQRVVLSGLLLMAAGSTVRAAPNCMTRILADVGAEEAPEQVLSRSNSTFGPVTQIRVDKATGRMLYCSKGSYCYWSNAFEFTTPCRIKRDDGVQQQSYFSYFTR